jgi:hypothetical protein
MEMIKVLIFLTLSLGNIRFVRDAQDKVTGFIPNCGRVLNFRFKKSPSEGRL